MTMSHWFSCSTTSAPTVNNSRLDAAEKTNPLKDGFQVTSITIEVPTGKWAIRQCPALTWQSRAFTTGSTINIVSGDNETIIHNKVAARILCVLDGRDAQAAVHAEQQQLAKNLPVTPSQAATKT